MTIPDARAEVHRCRIAWQNADAEVVEAEDKESLAAARLQRAHEALAEALRVNPQGETE